MDQINNQPLSFQGDDHQTLKLSTSSDPHHNYKIVLIGIGVLLLLVIGVGMGYYLGANNNSASPANTVEITTPNKDISPTTTKSISPTSSTTSVTTTKSYQSTTGNFSIKYPSIWSVTTGGSLATGTETIAFGPNVTNSTEDANTKMTIQMQKPNQETGIINGKTYKDAIVKGNGSNVVVSPITVGNVAGYKIVNAGMENVIIDKNNIIYNIYLGKRGQTKVSVEDQVIYDQILASFTFSS